MITVTRTHFRRRRDDNALYAAGVSTLTTDTPQEALDFIDAAHDDDDVNVLVDATFDVDQGRALLRMWSNNFGL